MKNNQIRDIAFMGMYLALFFVFDWLSNVIGIFQMPQGGSLGLGVLPLLLCSYHLGWKKGTLVCLVAVLMMFMTGTKAQISIHSSIQHIPAPLRTISSLRKGRKSCSERTSLPW